MREAVDGAERLEGSPDLPGDKSISHRALMFAALAEGRSVLTNVAPGADVRSTIRVLSACGASVELCGMPGFETDVVEVAGGGLRDPSAPLDCGNSGTTMRLGLGLLAGLRLEAELVGDASLMRRPMERVAAPLRAMGARVELFDGMAPIGLTRGTSFEGRDHTLSIPSGQMKTALTLAALGADGLTRLRGRLEGRDHGERMLAQFGGLLGREADGAITIAGRQRLGSTRLVVPADPSAAAYFLGAAAVLPGSRVTATRLCLNPTRTGFFGVLARAGAVVVVQPRSREWEPIGDLIVESGPARLRAVRVEAAEVPALIDELPLLAVLATHFDGETVVEGAGELRAKECDRIRAIVENLTAMGARITERPDGFVVSGPTRLRAANVSSWGDHRIAMAMGVAGLLAEGGTTFVEGAEWATVSQPTFFAELRKLAR